jgi:acyl-CoA synthetase (AMP-forming)/AMP-acid ligase II
MEPYGISEAGGSWVKFNELEPSDLTDDGKPSGKDQDCERAEFQIQDDDGFPLPPGKSGEICLRPTVPHLFMEEYYEKPEATVDAWEGLWLHTGDLGRIEGDGTLYFEGRKSYWLKRMGENISCQEIEFVINDHPDIVESAVVGVKNEEIGEEDGMAYVKVEASVEPEDIVEWCEHRLADFKVPRYIEFVDGFPRSETKNEIQRESLRQRGSGDHWQRY